MKVDLAADLETCTSFEELRDVVRRVPELMGAKITAGSTAYETSRAVSDLADSVTIRLLGLAEERLGPPPVPYSWLAAGSQGRRELTAGSDQDNSIVLDDAFQEERHGPYFKELSTFVCDGLNACGYVYCPGAMMAMTDRWRQPLAVWRRYFGKWIEQPDPKALMLASVFFDFRTIGRGSALHLELQRFVLHKAKGNTIFLAYLATNAMTRQPPIGIFRNLSPAWWGEHSGTLDLKLTGVMPIVELARIHALSAGIGEVNTRERLKALGDARVLSPTGAAEMADALDLIGTIRIRHQVRMAQEGRPIDNHVPIEELSSADRKRLRAAFVAVKRMQAAMIVTYRHGYG